MLDNFSYFYPDFYKKSNKILEDLINTQDNDQIELWENLMHY